LTDEARGISKFGSFYMKEFLGVDTGWNSGKGQISVTLCYSNIWFNKTINFVCLFVHERVICVSYIGLF